MDIPDVEGRFVGRRNGAPAHDLRPTGQPRTHKEARRISRRLIDRQQRPWPDEAHLASEDLEKLRQLVEPEAAQQMTDLARSLVRRDTAPVSVVGRRHGAELVEPERIAANAGALLPEHQAAGRRRSRR